MEAQQEQATLAQALASVRGFLHGGEPEQARSLCARILAARPAHADALHLAGLAEFKLGRAGPGIGLIERAIEESPHEPDYHNNLGVMLAGRFGLEAAAHSYRQAFLLRRLQNPADLQQSTFRCTTRTKLRHDIEQFRYLARVHDRSVPWQHLADIYASVLSEIDWPDNVHAVALTDAQLARMGDYNRALHIAKADAEPGGALHAGFDAGDVANRFHESEHGTAVIENFLSPQALRSLRRFCLESTVWFDFSHDGYLAATLDEGFACDLLVQISDELRERLPDVLGPHALHQLWAFKYDADVSGTCMHADPAAVNLNFWITPDDACLDPRGGGLRVYEVEASPHWSFEEYNQPSGPMRRLLEEQRPNQVVIPHRQNRALLFNPRLLHATDHVPFREGYENRRINITLLFGNGPS